MARTKLERMPLKELLELKRRIDEAVAKAQEKERGALKKKVAKMVRHAGFTLEELMVHDRERRQPAPCADDGPRCQPQTDWPSRKLEDEDRLENDLIG